MRRMTRSLPVSPDLGQNLIAQGSSQEITQNKNQPSIPQSVQTGSQWIGQSTGYGLCHKKQHNKKLCRMKQHNRNCVLRSNKTSA